MTAKGKELKKFNDFVHRTFNGTDAIFFMKSLQNIYKKHGGLEQLFLVKPNQKEEAPFLLQTVGKEIEKGTPLAFSSYIEGSLLWSFLRYEFFFPSI